MNTSFEVAAFNLFEQVIARPDLDLHGVCYAARLCEDKKTVMVEVVFSDETELTSSFQLPHGVAFDRDAYEERLMEHLSGGTVH